ncbi:MAG: hypothetical protein ACRDZ8_05190, partial [Acidimicrobiales bacterium]
CDLVESEDHLDAVLADLHRRISQPVAESVSVRFDGLAADAATQVPPGGTDLFPGVPLTISGRYRGQPDGRVEASDAAGAWNVAADVTVATNPAAAAVWARSYLRHLEDRYLSKDSAPAAEREALAAQIVEVSLRYRVLCRFTGWVAIDESGRRVEGRRRRVVQPVETPSGWAVTAAAAIARGAACFGATLVGGDAVAGGGAAGGFDATMPPSPPHQPAAPLGAPQVPRLTSASRPLAPPAPLPTPRPVRRLRHEEAPGLQPVSAPVLMAAYRARLEELLAEVGRSEAERRALALDARRLASDLESVRDLLPEPWREVPELLARFASALADGAVEVVTALVAAITNAVAAGGEEVEPSPRGSERRGRVFWR